MIEWGVSATVLLCAVILIRWIFRRLGARVRYALWLLVLARLLAPFSLPSPCLAGLLHPRVYLPGNMDVSKNTLQNILAHELLWFAKAAASGGLCGEDVNLFTMPSTPTQRIHPIYKSYQSYFMPQQEPLLDVVNRYLNPQKRPITAADLELAK